MVRPKILSARSSPLTIMAGADALRSLALWAIIYFSGEGLRRLIGVGRIGVGRIGVG
jgi:hypothetical protein